MDRRETLVYDGAGLLADAAGSIHIGGPNGALNQAGWTDQLLFQFTDSDADSSSFSPLGTRYLNGPAVDQIFAVESASGDPLWALTDHQGTPRDWVQQTTLNGNSSTAIAQHIRYTAFGAVSSVIDSSGAPLDARLSPLASYTGQLYDADADLMYYRARWYDPILGKFLNDDPMGFAAGDANVSRYVGNAGNFRFDATGLYDEPIYDPKDPDEIFHQILPPFLHPNFTEPTISDVMQDVAHAVLDPYKDELINVLELKPQWLVGVGTAGVGVGVVLVDQGVINEVPLPPKKIFSLPLTEQMILTQTVEQTWELGKEPWRLNDDRWRITPTTQLTVDLTDSPWILPPLRQVYIFETTPQISFPFHDPTNPTFVLDIGIHTAE